MQIAQKPTQLIEPVSIQFDGDDAAAIQFTIRTNKRRNLTSSQWAAVAVEADEIIAAIKAKVEEERREKQIANAANQYTEPCDNKLSQPRNEHANAAVTKTAELFNPNRCYINDAATHESGDFGVCDNKLLETKDPKPAGLQLSLVHAPSRQHYM